MSGGRIIFPEGEKNTLRLHMILLLKTPEINWQLKEEPWGVYEIWKLAPGRANGELIGWVGARNTAVEWKMTKGVAIQGGFSNTVEEAVGHMLAALDGGVFAKQHIQAELVS